MRNFGRLFALVILSICLTAAFFTGCDEDSNPVANQPAESGRFLITANYADGAGNLSLIDVDSGTVHIGIEGLGDTPNDLFIHNDKLYVLNSASADINVLDISDIRNIRSSSRCELMSGSAPQFFDVSANGKMYITNNSDTSVTVVDIETMQIEDTIKVGLSPADIEIAGDKAYVCNSGFKTDDWTYVQGTISVISTESNEVIKTIDVPMNPQYLESTETGMLHVVCTGNYNDVFGNILAIDTNTDAVTDTIAIGGKPAQLAFAAGGTAYVAAFGEWGEENPGLVFRYNTESFEILNGPGNPIEAGNGATRLIADGDTIYVSCFGADRIDKIVDGTVVEQYSVGDGPTPVIMIEI